MILDFTSLVKDFSCSFNGVLHIGAHHGNEYNTYKSMDISPIIFVEALPHVFDVLTKNVGSECVCINTALGNENGTVEMYVDEANSGGSSSVLKPKLHLSQFPGITFPRKVEVPITKLDLLDVPKCNFLNIDVQGYELEVLKGAKEYLLGVDYVMIEVNQDEVYENCVQVDELDKFLEQYGLKRVVTSWVGGNWGDAFYIKN